jgi:hypothetical protein
MLEKKKILNTENILWLLRAAAIIIGVTATTVATLLVFYFRMEKDQDTSIAETTKNLTETTTILKEHVKQADKTFGEIGRNMLEQRIINEKTSNALTEVSAVQWSIKEENGRLADSIKELAKEVRKSNGHTP